MQDPTKLLKQAVDAIIGDINSGTPAEEAVTKTAQELHLNHHLIKRASEVVNVALTYNHFQKHANEKDLDFPIVDADKVIKQIYSPTQKTANEIRSESFSTVTVFEDVPNFDKYIHGTEFKEAYSDLLKEAEEKKDIEQLSTSGLFDKVALALDHMEKDVQDLRAQYSFNHQEINRQFGELAEGWSKDASARVSFGEFESQAYALYGDIVNPYIDLLYKCADVKEDRGEHNPKYISFKECPEVEKLGSFLKAINDFSIVREALTTKVAEYIENKTKVAAAYRAIGQEPETPEPEPAAEKGAEEKVEAPALVVEEDIDPLEAAANEKLAALKDSEVVIAPEDEQAYLTYKQRAFLPTSVKASIIASRKKTAEEFLKEAEKFDLLGSVSSGLTDRYSTEKNPDSSIPSNTLMDNLDRKLLLERLIASDPILKSYPPLDVVNAYEQFMRLAPELSMEPEIVKGQLRPMVASQAMTPFDASQLVEANTKLMKQKLIAESAVKGLFKPKVD